MPDHALHQVRVECEVAARHLTIVERRAPWREDLGPDWTSFPIARLRYATAAKTWTLYWRDRNVRFHLHDLAPPSQRLDDLLAEVTSDPTAIFCDVPTAAVTCTRPARTTRSRTSRPNESTAARSSAVCSTHTNGPPDPAVRPRGAVLAPHNVPGRQTDADSASEPVRMGRSGGELAQRPRDSADELRTDDQEAASLLPRETASDLRVLL